MTLETAQELQVFLEKAEAQTNDPKELAQIGMMLLCGPINRGEAGTTTDTTRTLGFALIENFF